MHNSPLRIFAGLLVFVCSLSAYAQEEVRYSWIEIGYVQQDVSRYGVQFDPALTQTVEVRGSDGTGTKFRGSVGTWRNFFAFIDYNSSDIKVDAVVTNPQGVFPAQDEFDFTSVRGGVGVKWTLSPTTDFYGAVSYDSMDFDFGSLAGENFDVGDKDFGAEVGVRSIFAKKIELRARGSLHRCRGRRSDYANSGCRHPVQCWVRL